MLLFIVFIDAARIYRVSRTLLELSDQPLKDNKDLALKGWFKLHLESKRSSQFSLNPKLELDVVFSWKKSFNKFHEFLKLHISDVHIFSFSSQMKMRH